MHRLCKGFDGARRLELKRCHGCSDWGLRANKTTARCEAHGFVREVVSSQRGSGDCNACGYAQDTEMLQRATVQELMHCSDSLQARPHYTSELWTLALCTMEFYFLASTLGRLRACCSAVQKKTAPCQ